MAANRVAVEVRTSTDTEVDLVATSVLELDETFLEEARGRVRNLASLARGERSLSLLSYARSATRTENLRTLVSRVRRTIGSSFYRNSSMLMATTVVVAGLGYLYWIVAARGYDARSIGLGVALISGLTLTSMVCCFGIDSLLIQMLPKVTDDVAWSTMATVGVLTTAGLATVVSSGVAITLVHVSARYAVLGQPVYFTFFVIGSALTTVGSISDAVFVSARRSGRSLARNATCAAVKLPVMALPILLSDHPSALSILISWVVACFVSVAAAFGYHLRQVRPGYHPAVRGGLARLSKARNHIFAHFFTNIGCQIPQFLLPLIVVAFVSTKANAYFYLTWSVGGIFMVISPAVSSSLFAEGSNAEDLPSTARKSLRFVAILLLPMMAVVLIFNHRILSVFGPSYAAQGSRLLVLLALSAIPDALNNIYVSIERVKGHLGRVAVLNMSTASLTIGLAVLMIDHLGISGPGYAWLAAQSAGALVILPSICRVVFAKDSPHAVVPKPTKTVSLWPVSNVSVATSVGVEKSTEVSLSYLATTDGEDG